MTADVSGILNVDKPAGWTSFRVVSWIRRGSGIRKVGHAGTLDPPATGVLLVCLGQAARLSQYLMELPKTYRAEITLGIATDTYDGEGQPTFQGDPSSLAEAQIRETLTAFLGETEQVPPPYSAVKRQGRPAYAHARAGRTLALAPRKATVYRIDLLTWQSPLLTIEVECGKGTYIRSLAHDLGQRLGCGAHLSSLARLSIGPFALEAACSLAELQSAFALGQWQALLLPLDYGLGHFPPVTLDTEAEKEVGHGCPLPAEAAPFARLGRPAQGQRCRAYAEDGTLVGVLRFEASNGLWRPEKVFNWAREAGP